MKQHWEKAKDFLDEESLAYLKARDYKFSWKEIPGFLHEDEAAELQFLCRDKKCLEIGSLYGKSTVCISDTAESVLSIDPWAIDGDGQTLLTTVNKNILMGYVNSITGRDNVDYIIGFSYDVVPNLPDNFFDVVFIDSIHQYEDVCKEVLTSLPKLKENGLFVFHDYNGWPGVTEAVNFLFRKTYRVVNSVASAKKEDYLFQK